MGESPPGFIPVTKHSLAGQKVCTAGGCSSVLGPSSRADSPTDPGWKRQRTALGQFWLASQCFKLMVQQVESSLEVKTMNPFKTKRYPLFPSLPFFSFVFLSFFFQGMGVQDWVSLYSLAVLQL